MLDLFISCFFLIVFPCGFLSATRFLGKFFSRIFTFVLRIGVIVVLLLSYLSFVDDGNAVTGDDDVDLLELKQLELLSERD